MVDSQLHHIFKIVVISKNVPFCDFDDGLSVLDAEKYMFKSNFVYFEASILNCLVASNGGNHDVRKLLKIERYFFRRSVGDLAV